MRFGGGPLAPPDPDLIRALARLLAETGLSEIEYRVGRHQVRVARNNVGDGARTPAMSAAVAVPEQAAATPRAHSGELMAPMVGTAYLAPQPGADPFVRVGDMVVAGQTMLIIEAMKVMNEIRAPRPGRVIEILAADAQPVEYGAVLMLIE